VRRGIRAYLVVVDMLLSIDGFGSLDVLLGSDVLLDNLGCDLGADLGGVLLVSSLILVEEWPRAEDTHL
jgi:hypothetical protein